MNRSAGAYLITSIFFGLITKLTIDAVNHKKSLQSSIDLYGDYFTTFEEGDVVGKYLLVQKLTSLGTKRLFINDISSVVSKFNRNLAKMDLFKPVDISEVPTLNYLDEVEVDSNKKAIKTRDNKAPTKDLCVGLGGGQYCLGENIFTGGN